MREMEEGLEQLQALTSLTTEAFMVLLQMMVQDFYFQWGKKLYWQKASLQNGKPAITGLSKYIHGGNRVHSSVHIPKKEKNVCIFHG